MEELKRSNHCPFFVEPDICRPTVEQRGYGLVFTDKHYFAKQRKAQAERS